MATNTSVFRNRPDTFFGVCEAIGQDFGINANIIRVAFGAGVLVNPLAVVAFYGILAVAVAVSRIAVPTVTHAVTSTRSTPEAVNDIEDVPLARAA
jgi:phage shock protein C